MEEIQLDHNNPGPDKKYLRNGKFIDYQIFNLGDGSYQVDIQTNESFGNLSKLFNHTGISKKLDENYKLTLK